MADFGQRAARVTGHFEQDRCSPVARLLWPDRRSSAAVDSLVEEKTSIVSFHGADVTVDMSKPAYRETTRQMLGAVTLVLVRSESLRRAVIHLGCAERKIEIQRTGIPVDEISFSRTKLRHRGDRMAIRPGWSLDRKERSVSHAPRFCTFPARTSKCEPNDCWRRNRCSANFRFGT